MEAQLLRFLKNHDYIFQVRNDGFEGKAQEVVLSLHIKKELTNLILFRHYPQRKGEKCLI